MSLFENKFRDTKIKINPKCFANYSTFFITFAPSKLFNDSSRSVIKPALYLEIVCDKVYQFHIYSTGYQPFNRLVFFYPFTAPG